MTISTIVNLLNDIINYHLDMKKIKQYGILLLMIEKLATMKHLIQF